MDPDAQLESILKLVAVRNQNGELSHDEAMELVDLISALDIWLKVTKSFPRAWSPKGAESGTT